MLIAFHSFASRYVGDGEVAATAVVVAGGGAEGEMRSLQWFRLFQGVRAVKEAGERWI